MPPRKYKEQIAQVKAVIDEKRHLQLERQWLDLKKALDLIADNVETFPEHGRQCFSIDAEILSEGMRRNLRKILSGLAAAAIVEWINDHPDGIMQTTTRYRKMLAGQNIIIRNLKNFEKYRRDVVKLLKFIRADAETKFRKTSHTTDITSYAQKRKKKVIKLSFPEPVQWDKVTLKMKEGDRDINISYNEKNIETVDYMDLGFYSGAKQQKPDRTWQFLVALSKLSATDIQQATPDNLAGMFMPPKVNSQNVQQIKRQLVKKLGDLFATGADPFWEYGGYYHPKFKLLSEPGMRSETLWSSGGGFDDNQLYGDINICEAE